MNARQHLIHSASALLAACAWPASAEAADADQELRYRAAQRPEVGRYSSGPRVSQPSDDEHGSWLLFHGERAGDHIELTLPGVLPGRYLLRLVYKAHAERGVCAVSVGAADGSGQEAVGEALDQRGAGFRSADIGTCSIPRMGHRTLRLTLLDAPAGVGKLSIVAIALIPDPAEALAVPTGLRVEHVAASHCELAWDADALGDGLLIQRRGGKTGDWRVVGTPPADSGRFTAPGLCDSSRYQFRLCRYGARGRSAWSEPITVETVSGEHRMRGRYISRARNRGRIGGGTMLEREDGSLLVYAHYQKRLKDAGRFEIHALDSADGGQSWSERTTVLADPDCTYMMPQLLRLRSGEILFCYTQRDLKPSWGKRFCRRSSDDGRSWSEPLEITDGPVSWQELQFTVPTGPHDRLIQTSSGRIIFPIHYPYFGSGERSKTGHLRETLSRVFYSDDDGRSWQSADRLFSIRGVTAADAERRDHQGLWEPSIVEVKPGELLMYFRSNTGWYYQSRSFDDGSSWTAPEQSNMRAPLCPAKLIALGDGRIAAIGNHIIDYDHLNLGARWDLASMVSADGGRSWHQYRSLEFADPHAQEHHLIYCYPSLLRDRDRWHLCYYKNFELVYQQLPGDWFGR